MTFQTIASEMNLSAKNVAAVIELFLQGNTVPFIARYRKEATGNMDEVQIRTIEERHNYLTELEERKQTILGSIHSQGKLTDELKKQIEECSTKNALEDLYLPYKPKRRTRAMIAREKGYEPLALSILEQPVMGEACTDEDAVQGACDIIAEMIAENADVRTFVRELFAAEGVVVSKVIEDKKGTPTKFEQYYDFKEKVTTIPSHRYLAIRRGEKEDVLSFHIDAEPDSALSYMRKEYKLNPKSIYAQALEEAIGDSYKRLLSPSIETDLRVDLKLKADREAIEIFASNLRNLLLSAPMGTRSVIGIDPGLRTGCKCAAVDSTGKFLENTTIYLSQEFQSKKELLQFITKFKPFAIAIGNGTAGRETESFVRKLLSDAKISDLIVVSVSEAGASVYSASDVAREEFPELDLTIRGAISIARRLQDPLSELVKVDPKAIGVGQYQHDVYQPFLQDKLQQVVESCVNQVGVEVNTASASLLSYVSGIGPALAVKIVKHRDSFGKYKSRESLREVAGMGPRTFEQAAGFLRVRDGAHALDASAVHPERYALVEQMAKDMGVSLEQLMANPAAIQKIDLKKYISEDVGELTLKDIVQELKKPGRDPRAFFEPPKFREDVMTVKDLKLGMKLEGIVTNVTAFGAFVDIGVHQDGLVHVSQLSHDFVKDPHTVVKAGDKIQVEVQSIDAERNRIGLTAKLGQAQPKKKEKFSHNPFAAL